MINLTVFCITRLYFREYQVAELLHVSMRVWVQILRFRLHSSQWY